MDIEIKYVTHTHTHTYIYQYMNLKMCLLVSIFLRFSEAVLKTSHENKLQTCGLPKSDTTGRTQAGQNERSCFIMCIKFIVMYSDRVNERTDSWLNQCCGTKGKMCHSTQSSVQRLFFLIILKGFILERGATRESGLSDSERVNEKSTAGYLTHTAAEFPYYDGLD